MQEGLGVTADFERSRIANAPFDREDQINAKNCLNVLTLCVFKIIMLIKCNAELNKAMCIGVADWNALRSNCFPNALLTTFPRADIP